MIRYLILHHSYPLSPISQPFKQVSFCVAPTRRVAVTRKYIVPRIDTRREKVTEKGSSLVECGGCRVDYTEWMWPHEYALRNEKYLDFAMRCDTWRRYTDRIEYLIKLEYTQSDIFMKGDFVTFNADLLQYDIWIISFKLYLSVGIGNCVLFRALWILYRITA